MFAFPLVTIGCDGKGGGGGRGLGTCGGEPWLFQTGRLAAMGGEEDGKVEITRLGSMVFQEGDKHGEVGLGLEEC